ncbi:MAG: hypothetical protein R2770_05880 [Acidimicrobiales bacterium]|nr:hypothetical protein [Acidimicrobiales bacterium]
MKGHELQDDLDRVADSLDTLSEALAELGIAALRAAIDDPDSDGRRPEVEKRISRARRSVEKAAVILRNESTAGML